MKLVKVIYDNRKQKNKDGIEFKPTMFFLENEEGRRIAVKPLFKEDYPIFDYLAVKEHNDKA